MLIFQLFSVVLLTCVIFISTLFSSLSSYSQEIYHLPEITGTYRVRTESRHFIDDSREETFTQKPDDKRELMVQFWYPADIPEGTPSGLVATGIEPIARNMPVYIPTMLRTVYETLYGNAVLDAQPLVQQQKCPVIIFSHGNGSFRSQNAFLMEELASHGYFVAAIDHPYNAAAVQFPDGRIVNGLGFGLDDNLHAVADIHAIDVSFLIDQLHILNGYDPKFFLQKV